MSCSPCRQDIFGIATCPWCCQTRQEGTVSKTRPQPLSGSIPLDNRYNYFEIPQPLFQRIFLCRMLHTPTCFGFPFDHCRCQRCNSCSLPAACCLGSRCTCPHCILCNHFREVCYPCQNTCLWGTDGTRLHDFPTHFLFRTTLGHKESMPTLSHCGPLGTRFVCWLRYLSECRIPHRTDLTFGHVRKWSNPAGRAPSANVWPTGVRMLASLATIAFCAPFCF